VIEQPESRPVFSVRAATVLIPPGTSEWIMVCSSSRVGYPTPGRGSPALEQRGKGNAGVTKGRVGLSLQSRERSTSPVLCIHSDKVVHVNRKRWVATLRGSSGVAASE
jgi:hypothetical protein